MDFSPLTVATWNCAGAIGRKWHVVESLGAHLVIIQECSSDVVQIAATAGWTALWTGTNPKGLALVARPGWMITELPHAGHWYLPASVTGPLDFTLVGFWAIGPKLAGKTYTRQATMMVDSVAAYPLPLVVGGDFNAWDSKPHLAAVTALTARGLSSAYHRFHGLERNQEQHPTLYWQWREGQQFHVDLMFLPDTWKIESVEVGGYSSYTAAKLSDHAPVVVRAQPQLGPATRRDVGST